MLGVLNAELVLVPKGSVRTKAPVPPAECGRLGGLARREWLSPERRQEIARAAGKARARMAAERATHEPPA